MPGDTTALTVVVMNVTGRLYRPVFFAERIIVENLNFYTVDLKYVDFLKKAELKKRGFSRVPDMDYGKNRKPKFLCGIVLQINNQDYYVPVTSFTIKKPDNFLIYAANGKVVSSLRFNYMFPVPKELITERKIASEPDRTYRALLSQELRFCINNQDEIRRLAKRTYKRVLLGKSPSLVANSCDFTLLEEQCRNYIKTNKLNLDAQINKAKKEQKPCATHSIKTKSQDER